MLEFPLHDGFFPQITLSREEVKYYKRLGKERVTQLVRIIEDADCAYKWKPVDGPTHRRHRSRFSGLSLDTKDELSVPCQQANFLAIEPTTKSAQASTLLKASVQLSNTTVDEVLRAVAKVKTKDFRKVARYMHGDAFVDGRTLFTFPRHSAHRGTHSPSYSYRAIKWHAYKTQRSRHGGPEKLVDFCYLEYAGQKKTHPGSTVVGFCVQESIARDREVPTLEQFGMARGYLSRMGLIVSRTHPPQSLRVTAICQIDGTLNPLVRRVLEKVMQQSVCAVARLAGLVARQRVSTLRFVEPWQWVPNADRKACAVCLRGFYFRRKHHCRTCGEVVCSSCALLRELEEPIFDITHLRVCSACMTSAATHDDVRPGTGPLSSTSYTTASHLHGLRSPQHDAYDDTIFQVQPSRDCDRRSACDGVETELDLANVPRPHVRAQDKVVALTDVVRRIRNVRDTIHLTMSEAVDGERFDEASDGTAEHNDVYSDLTSIWDALESSVSNFDAALATATHAAPAMYYTGPSDCRHDATDRHGSPMTPEQLTSVARITFAAARATRQAGQAFLAIGERHARQDENPGDRDEVASVSAASTRDPTRDDSDDDEQDVNPYATSNYEKLMATYEPVDHEDDADRRDAHRFVDSVRRTTDIYELEKQIQALQQSLHAAQQQLAEIDRHEPEPEARTRQQVDAGRDGAAPIDLERVFAIDGDYDDAKRSVRDTGTSLIAQGLSLPLNDSRVHGETTQELVAELRGVMASSETSVRASTTSRQSRSRPSTPRITKLPRLPPCSPQKPLKDTLRPSMPATSVVHRSRPDSLQSTRLDPVSSPYQHLSMARTEGSYLQAFGTSYSDDDYASKDDSDKDVSDDSLSRRRSLDQNECPNQPYQTRETGFVDENLDALLPKRNAVAKPALLSPRCALVERDERNELLARRVRPRSSSVPLSSSQMEGVSSGKPCHDVSTPSWSDDAPKRSCTVHHVEAAVHEIRSCLASCRWECPSETERARKLSSVFKVLRSLHREGVRSQFRTLQHSDLCYAQMLEATPSVIKLLKLAGYVSLHQKLTMRRVDPDYLALFLRELEQELHAAG